ncbi:D-alanine--D-alanine ligase [Amycolatopsis acidiphila]|uniref:D-alanine--D-alanine ligase n=1 Tax=Amycolatopsis acidiphila TaxID=715473 RepID=A0A558A2A6_9PSEU|nr:D-alanine--D-alanine ligase [Amycolatopsis acidiphila]TVT18394.1 D-alanine--D-alanine ligase [Amycolatopsis acidiphila]UIJ60125.1 D-alanine--D-alanine ligase [Amycolatopsis acidiphila]GHG61230.1 D-alanine--D-alanine ligase [Amycolatopsis acidiphila]
MVAPTVAVLAGGLSHERDVSLRSGRRLSAALRTQGLTVEEWDTDAGLLNRLRTDRPDAAVIALHGGQGENGSVQTILEMLKVPYVGTSSQGCRRAWDKPTAKALIAEAGFSTPGWVVLPNSTFRELGAQDVLDAIVEHLGLPLILKPDQGGSALGTQVVRDAAELPAAMVGCFAYGDTVLAERLIDGTEIAIGVVERDGGPQALPAVEIVPESGVYNYTSRYTAGLTDFFSPARLSDDVAKAVGELAVAAHRLLGMRDISRTDAIIAPDGTVQFLEVNSSPGLTETSTVPMAMESAGTSLGEVFADLIGRAIERTA